MSNHFSTLNDTDSLTPGTVVSVPAYLIFKHKGVISDRYWNGRPMVYACSAATGEVREETWETFTSGNDVTIEGYLGNLNPLHVVARARSCVSKKYDLFRWNCEHFVYFVHGLEPRSPQLAAVVTGAGVLLALAAIGARA